MLNLDSTISLTDAAIGAVNLCDKFSLKDLDAIGEYCRAGYLQDVNSRRDWLRRNEAGMDLALQVQKDKSFPWPGCSSVAFPLVTVAAMQFHARAYPSIVNGTDIVKYRVVGEDPTGEQTVHAQKISSHMSYQVLEEDTAWEEQTDRLLFNLSIIGTCFKKTYYSSALGHNVSEMVMAKDLVLNYWAKSVEDCSRKTHIVPMQRNEIHEKIMRGVFRDIREEPWYHTTPLVRYEDRQQFADNRQGKTMPQADQTTELAIREQHCRLDLDGDGYEEPYIVTFEEQSGCVLRIVASFDVDDMEKIQSGQHRGRIASIKAGEYFTKFSFIPSPDGGIYDIGFGVFLGPLNESVNSLVNQLIDAGTMANTAGGFLARGAKIRGGVYQFSPFGWNRVDSTGDDLRKSVFPLPVREPSMVLFQLLSLLIQYSNRVAGTTEMMVGENPGQNTPAATSQAMIEMGQKIYSSIFKRVWRAEKEEFRKLYILNGKFLPETGPMADREDYLHNPELCVPSADPSITSDHMQVVQAQMLRDASMSVPGYDRQAVERRFLRALHVEGVEAIYPGPDKTGSPSDPKMELVKIKAQDLELKQMMFVQQLQEQARVNNAKITKLMADAALALEEAGGVKEGHKIAAFQTYISALKQHSDTLAKQADVVMKGMERGSDLRGMDGMAGATGDTATQGMGEGPTDGADGAMG